MARTNTTPWTKLFPGLDHTTSIIRDSNRRKNGDRHYRVKLRMPHGEVAEVRSKLAPYGFTVTKNGVWSYYDRHDCIKCIRHTEAAR